ncbi:hypothetical protein JB92DRAFT_3107751 [Gautieria morchelliformis]|nr:hypothetical protein JB92DRAFT_3107751 [Gautieria morchelliformis]
MGLSDSPDHYLDIMSAVHEQVTHHRLTSKKCKQDVKALALICINVEKKFLELKQFDNSWPIHDMITGILCNKSNYSKNKVIQHPKKAAQGGARQEARQEDAIKENEIPSDNEEHGNAADDGGDGDKMEHNGGQASAKVKDKGAELADPEDGNENQSLGDEEAGIHIGATPKISNWTSTPRKTLSKASTRRRTMMKKANDPTHHRSKHKLQACITHHFLSYSATVVDQEPASSQIADESQPPSPLQPGPLSHESIHISPPDLSLKSLPNLIPDMSVDAPTPDTILHIYKLIIAQAADLAGATSELHAKLGTLSAYGTGDPEVCARVLLRDGCVLWHVSAQMQHVCIVVLVTHFVEVLTLPAALVEEDNHNGHVIQHI